MDLAESDPWEEGSVRVTAVDDSSSWMDVTDHH